MMAETYTVPQSVRNNAKRGLEQRKKKPKSQQGGLTASEASAQGIGSGVQRASNLIQGSVSADTIKRMAGFFSRHGKNIARARANPSQHPKMYIADLLWGGAAGERWATSQWNKIKKERAKKSLYDMIDDTVYILEKAQ